MSPLRLYCWDPSVPTRAVYLCLASLGLEHTREVVNLQARERFDHDPEFSKINPQHTIPTIEDDGVVLWDSHAINAYLVSKYGKDDSLYPKDLQKRAIVDQRLHFDSGVLFPSIMGIIVPLLWRRTTKEVPEEKRQKVLEAYDLMEKFLEGHDYIAGDNFTIADFSCVTSVSTLAEALRCTVDKHPRVKAWLQRCKDTLPGYKEAQDKGLAMFKGAADAAMK